MTNLLERRDWIAAGVVGGIAAAAALAVFALLAQWRVGAMPASTYEFLAAAVVGGAATGAAWAVPLGVGVLVVCSILWAFAYLYVAQRQSQLLDRPLISGIGFGVVVWFVMLALLVPIGKFPKPTIYTFDRDVVAFTLFFGIPLAFVTSRLVRRSA